MLRSASGLPDAVVGETRVGARDNALEAWALTADYPVLVDDIREDARVRLPAHLRALGIHSSVAMVIQGIERPWGVLAAHASEPDAFVPGDAIWLRTVANVLAAAIQRQEAEDAVRVARDELEALIDASPVPIVAYDREGAVTLWNAAAERVFGWSAEEALGRLLPFVPDDRLEEFHEIRRNVLAGKAYRGSEARRIRRGGSPIDVGFWNAPVRDAAGRVKGVVSVLTDFTARKRYEDGLAFMTETSEALSSSLDYGRMPHEIARLAVPRLADCCIVDILEDDDEQQNVHRLAVVHVDPAAAELVAELERRYPTDPDAPNSFVGGILREGRPRLHAELPDSLLADIARDGEHLAALRGLGLRSGIFAPLAARGRMLGAITLLVAGSGRTYDQDDFALATDLARHAALAIDNARLFRQRSRIAATLQRSLLPPALPEIPGVEVATRYRAAGEGLEVGGDFYDVFETGRADWAVVIGDVCGKGTEAAAVTGLTRHAIRASAMRERSPSRTLQTLNEAVLAEYEQRTFCTVAYGLLDVREGGARLTFACGGHPLPLRVSRSGEVTSVGAHGTLIGVFPDPTLEDQVVELEPGDTLVFYTDGLVEGYGEQMEAGERMLERLLEGCAGLDADDVARRIDASIVEAGPSVERDDIAFIVLRVSG